MPGSTAWTRDPTADPSAGDTTTQSLNPPTVERNQSFGFAAATSLDGQRIILTDQREAQPGSTAYGARVYVDTVHGPVLEGDLRIPDHLGVVRVDENQAAVHDRVATLSGWTETNDGNWQLVIAFFQRDDQGWSFDQLLEVADAQSSANWAGATMALDDDLLILKSRFHNPIWTYQRIDDQWQRTGEIVNLPGIRNGQPDFFSHVMAYDGQTLVVASAGPLDAPSQGALVVFERAPDSPQQWAQTAYLTHTTTFEGRLAESLAVRGDLIIAGGPNNNSGSSSFKGFGYVYRNTENGWAFEQRLQTNPASGSDDAGASVTFVGSAIALTTPFQDQPEIWSGATYLFEYDANTQAWIQTRQLAPEALSNGDGQGTHLTSLNGRLVTAVNRHDGLALDHGRAFITTPSNGLDQIHALTLTANQNQAQRDIALQPGDVGIELLPDSDTGLFNHDRITQRNNANPQSTLRFHITGLQPGDTVQLLDPAAGIVATGLARTNELILETNGTAALPDGMRYLQAQVTSADGHQSGLFRQIALRIDTQAPTLTFDPIVTAKRAVNLAGTVSESDAQVNVDPLVGPVGFQVPNRSAVLGVDLEPNLHPNQTAVWQLDAHRIPDWSLGTHDLFVNATDPAGNTTTLHVQDALTIVETGSVAGRVFQDHNANALHDPNEPGLPGLHVYADLNQNQRPDEHEPRAITQTDDPATPHNEAGLYRINQVPDGPAVVRLDTQQHPDLSVTGNADPARQWRTARSLGTTFAPGATQYAGFGSSVSLADHVMVVGSRFSSAAYYHASAGIYVRPNPDAPWTLATYLDEGTEQGINRRVGFGSAVLATDRYVAIGTPNDSSGGLFAGGVMLYEPDPETGQWSTVGQLFPDLPDQPTPLGNTLAGDENTLIVGSTNGNSGGGVSIYRRDPDDPLGWRLEQVLTPPVSSGTGTLYAQNLVYDNGWLAVAASRNTQTNDTGETQTGAIYLYRRNPASPSNPDQPAWSFVQTLRADTPSNSRGLGLTLDMRGDLLATSDASQLYVFHKNQDADTWNPTPALADASTANLFAAPVLGDNALYLGGSDAQGSFTVVPDRNAAGPDSWRAVARIEQTGLPKALDSQRRLITTDPRDSTRLESQGALFIHQALGPHTGAAFQNTPTGQLQDLNLGVQLNLAPPGDFNGDDRVDQADLDLVLAHWGRDITTAGLPETWIRYRPGLSVAQAELDDVLAHWGQTRAPIELN